MEAYQIPNWPSSTESPGPRKSHRSQNNVIPSWELSGKDSPMDRHSLGQKGTPCPGQPVTLALPLLRSGGATSTITIASGTALASATLGALALGQINPPLPPKPFPRNPLPCPQPDTHVSSILGVQETSLFGRIVSPASCYKGRAQGVMVSTVHGSYWTSQQAGSQEGDRGAISSILPERLAADRREETSPGNEPIRPQRVGALAKRSRSAGGCAGTSKAGPQRAGGSQPRSSRTGLHHRSQRHCCHPHAVSAGRRVNELPLHVPSDPPPRVPHPDLDTRLGISSPWSRSLFCPREPRPTGKKAVVWKGPEKRSLRTWRGDPQSQDRGEVCVPPVCD